MIDLLSRIKVLNIDKRGPASFGTTSLSLKWKNSTTRLILMSMTCVRRYKEKPVPLGFMKDFVFNTLGRSVDLKGDDWS